MVRAICAPPFMVRVSAVTVTGPGKWIFLAGVGAEAETDGSILHVGDFTAQCRYAYEKIGKLLAAHGATMADVVKPEPISIVGMCGSSIKHSTLH